MALKLKHDKGKFGVGDRVRVLQKIKEGDKTRSQAFEGIVLSIKGRGENRTFTVRRIGAQQIGIERIFPIESPMVEEVKVIRKGNKGVRRAKLYYTRDQSKKEIEKIYSRAAKKEKSKKTVTKKKTKKAKKKSIGKKSEKTTKKKRS